MNPGCWICRHYCWRSWIVTTGELTVSGKLAKFRKHTKHRCALKQEDKYPRNCDFEENTKLRDELNKRYPDLAAWDRRLDVTSKVVTALTVRIEEARERPRV